MSLLLFIIVSVIGIISYSQNTEMPEISTIKVPNIIFDSADMLNDEYKPISNVSIQYGFNLTFNQQTKPVNVLNFGNGLASDITGVLQIDIQRIVIMHDTKTRRRRRILSTDTLEQNATAEMKSIHFKLL
eukprot:280641_1